MMPRIAEGDANKVWIVPSEIGRALEGLGSTMNSLRGIPDEVEGPRKRVDMGAAVPDVAGIEAENARSLQSAHDEVAAAIAAAQASEAGAGARGGTSDPQPSPDPSQNPSQNPSQGLSSGPSPAGEPSDEEPAPS
jgi:hypothetical protein